VHPDDAVRRVGDRYELHRRIARGGGGTVWAAEDTTLGRTVAVKAIDIPDELPPDERDRARSRVLHEARAAARLDHGATVVVHDVLDEDDRLYLVMELVEAPTLRQLVHREGRLDEARAAAIGLELADVLSHAHRNGIVHRDVKPSNVFVLEDGSVKLADFGIAALTGETSLTRTGVALGSPSYLAPEQAQGDAASPAADLWGLGASLYYALEGTPPFDRGNAIATVHAVVHDPVPAVSDGGRLGPIVEGLLRKDPSARPTLEEVTDQLRTITRAEPDEVAPTAPATTVAAPEAQPAPEAESASAPPEPTRDPAPATDPAPTGPIAPPGRRRRWVALAAIAAVVALLGVGIVSLLGGDDPATEMAAPETDDPDGEAEGDPPAEDDPPAEGDPGADGSPDEGTAPEAADGDEPADDGDATDPGTASGDEVPEEPAPGDWQVLDGETYQVAVPAGWEVRDGPGNLTDYVDPATGTYLRVDWTDDPAADPVADWEANEAGFAERQDGYERLRLDPVTFRGEPAAWWEYRYTDGGAALHAINLNVLAGDRAYALNLQAPQGDWDAAEAMFPMLVGGFEPAG
jgi:eukaryotic-like serine/threonine-protein kinase